MVFLTDWRERADGNTKLLRCHETRRYGQIPLKTFPLLRHGNRWNKEQPLSAERQCWTHYFEIHH